MKKGKLTGEALAKHKKAIQRGLERRIGDAEQYFDMPEKELKARLDSVDHELEEQRKKLLADPNAPRYYIDCTVFPDRTEYIDGRVVYHKRKSR